MRIVVTGIGVIASNGIGRDVFWNALEKGISGIKPITLFDTAYFRTKLAGECVDFSPETFLGSRGLRNLDRATLLVSSAAKLALDDSGLIIDDGSDEVGVVTATTISVSADLAKFTKEEAEEGSQFVSPGLFPPTTMNFPSSHISIRFKLKGFNTTISTGYTAGLDALKYGIMMIKNRRAKRVLVCGVEALSFSSYVGFYKIGFLAGIKGEELSCPFDARRNGIIFGEGASALLIESEESACERKGKIYCSIDSIESMFDAYRATKYSPYAHGLKRSIIQALASAKINHENIDCICASANSVPEQDRLETRVIKEIFGIYAYNTPISAIKSMLGEGVSVSGLLQVISGIGMMEKNVIFPTINYKVHDPECDLDYVPNVSRKSNVRRVLVNCFGPGGHNTVAVLSKYE